MNSRFVLSSFLVLLSCALAYIEVNAQNLPVQHPATHETWGYPAAGLRMSLALDTHQKKPAAFLVALQNTGQNDILLSLGYMLNNGKVQLPTGIRFLVTDAKGHAETLYYEDRRYPLIAGRVDEYQVPLRSGSSYSLRIGIDQLVRHSKYIGQNLPHGKFKAVAEFDGVSDQPSNKKQRDIGLMNYWKRHVASNAVFFDH